ncbi:MAG: 4-alpha-glucanotransferase [Ilumatobacteraceae bacterium]
MYDDWGIANGYHAVDGTWHDTPAGTRDFLRSVMGDPQPGQPLWFIDEGSSHRLQGRCHLMLEDGSDFGDIDELQAHTPIGYHRLTPLDGGPVTTLVVAPRVCRDASAGWGVAAQVYSLWRPDGWGIGDLRDVEVLGRQIAALGAGSLLLSPLHAPSPASSQEASPYYPSSRRWLNPMLIPGDSASPVSNEAGGLIDRNRVWPAKRRALVERFVHAAEGSEWSAWADAQGEDLWQFCTWNALAERLGSRWREWPADFRRPDTEAVRDLPVHDAQFGTTRDFHAWLQWLTLRTLERTAASAGVGLIGDLAVGCSPAGADAWMHQDLMSLEVVLGAPPDPFNAGGQSWGLPPFIPWRLRAAQYRPFIGMVRAACQAMAGLRIDHVMGLFRQFWIPQGGEPADGTYVQLPAAELLAIIRLEAARANAYVIGEDLGTVEPGVHEAMKAGHIMGTKVWWFDTDPTTWRPDNLATVTTHDLPTVFGVWHHTDGTPEMAASLQQAVTATTAAGASVELHRSVAESDARLCLIALDDLAGAVERPNHPGTVGDEHPNWCRRLQADTATILATSPGSEIVAAVAAARPASAHE